MVVATLTPEAVIGLFDQLNNSQKDEFLDMFGKRCSVYAALLVINGLTKEQQIELNGKMYQGTIDIILPLAAKSAWEWFQENPSGKFEKAKQFIEIKLQSSWRFIPIVRAI